MPSPKQIFGFFVLVLVYCALLLAPWPGLDGAYAAAFRAGGNVVFHRFWFWPEGWVRFVDPDARTAVDLPPGVRLPAAEGVKDTVMILENRSTPRFLGFLRTSSREVGYKPTAVLIALMLATPTSWRRRGKSLLWGLLLVHGFILLRLTVTLVANGFGADKGYALFHPAEFGMTVLDKLDTVLLMDPTVSYVAPAFFWFLLAFRPSQWASRGQTEPVPSGSDQSR